MRPPGDGCELAVIRAEYIAWRRHDPKTGILPADRQQCNSGASESVTVGKKNRTAQVSLRAGRGAQMATISKLNEHDASCIGLAPAYALSVACVQVPSTPRGESHRVTGISSTLPKPVFQYNIANNVASMNREPQNYRVLLIEEPASLASMTSYLTIYEWKPPNRK